ncbi:hypothetical protein I588_04540 [Enterococcus pallens ATCC BAA-351]|uniref:Uncharacterized protein n=1 Tax=Enterococcus pallens ATCC BAA-351 TaxID=1158607 RepID=R2SPQ1_9ENTE|nr:hypothetical protein UAU_01713 [Enterococcus pallens ATCC BAA-351]EOU14890.1 hypothetical protein I588_04540 [Enterococcus pallens ATCC BAA-351]
MPEYVFAFMVWIAALVSIGINAHYKDHLRRILIMVSFLLVIIVSIGVYLVIKGVIK